MGTSVEDNDGSFGGGLEGVGHTLEVEAFCGRVEVGVCFDGHVDRIEDLVVIGPGRGG